MQGKGLSDNSGSLPYFAAGDGLSFCEAHYYVGKWQFTCSTKHKLKGMSIAAVTVT